PNDARKDKSRTTNMIMPPDLHPVIEPVGRPGAVPVGTELEPDFAAFFERSVPLAVDHDVALAVDLDLILDALADEKCRPRGSRDHPRRGLRRQRGKNLDVLGPDRNIDRAAAFDAAGIVRASEDDAVRRSVQGDRHLTRGIAALHPALE